MAENVESMLKKDIFKDDYYIIRRDGHDLFPPEYDQEKRDLQLYVKKGPSKRARKIINVDGLVINTKDKIVELILEYEAYDTNQNPTNAKDMTGNFIAPFLVDQYESNFIYDNDTYELDPNRTIVLLIIWFPEKRANTPKDQAAIQKGKINEERLRKIKDILCKNSKIFNGDIIISDDMGEVLENLKESIFNMRKDLI